MGKFSAKIYNIFSNEYTYPFYLSTISYVDLRLSITMNTSDVLFRLDIRLLSSALTRQIWKQTFGIRIILSIFDRLQSAIFECYQIDKSSE